MKIAYILVEFPVQYNTYNMHQILKLREKGVDVLILSLRKTIKQHNLTHTSVSSEEYNVKYFNDFLAGENQYIRQFCIKFSKKKLNIA